MANELARGERKVYTTPSSLASRMGVVRGQTGDPFKVAGEELSNTINVFAVRQSRMAEERWKAKFKTKGYETISQYAHDNRLNLAGFTNKTNEFIAKTMEQVPAKFSGYAKEYLSIMAAQNANVIQQRVFDKEQSDTITGFNEDRAIMLNNFKEIIMQLGAGEFPEFYEQNMFPRLVDNIASWESIRSTLDASRLTGNFSHTKEEYQYKMQNLIEEYRLTSHAKEFLDIAFEEQKEARRLNKLEGIPIDKDIMGFDSETAGEYDVASISSRVKTSLLKNLDAYVRGEHRGDIDSGMFTDIREEDRVANASKVKTFIEEYSKVHEASLIGESQTDLANKKIFVQNVTSGKRHTADNPVVNDVLLPPSPEAFNQIQNMYDLSADEKTKLRNSWMGAMLVHNEGVHVVEGRMGYNLGLTTATRKLQEELQIPETQAKALAEQYMQKYVFGLVSIMMNQSGYEDDKAERIFNQGLDISALDPSVEPLYLDEADFTITPLEGGGYLAGDGLETAKVMTRFYGEMIPEFAGLIESAANMNIDDPANINYLFNIADMASWAVKERGGVPPKGINTELLDPLVEAHYMRKSGQFGTLQNIANIYLSKVNPSATDYDEKLSEINKMWSPEEAKGWKLNAVDRTEPDWLKNTIKDWISFNPKFNELITVFGVRHKVAWYNPISGIYQLWSLLPGGPSPGIPQSEWNEERLDYVIQRMLDEGLEDVLKMKMATSFSNVTDIKMSDSKNSFQTLAYPELKDSSTMLGSDFDYRLWKQLMNMVYDMDKWGFTPN